MLYVRLARGGIVEVLEAVSAALDDDLLILQDALGRMICRFERLDVLAYGPKRELLDTGPEDRPSAVNP
jgi:hypothetical protein